MFSFLRLDRRTIIRVFTLTALLFFAAHIYRFTASGFTHDSLLINQSDDQAFQISIGRFLQPLYWKLRGDIPAPFLIGIISCLFLSASICLITVLLSIKSLLSIVLICSVLTANAAIIQAGGSYISWMDVYMIAFFLSMLCVYVCERWRFGFLAAPLFLCASLGLYQSYIQTAALMMLILLVKAALHHAQPRAIFFTALKYLFVLLAGLLLYALMTRLVLHITGIPMADSANSITGIGDYEGVPILRLLADAWLYPFRYLSNPATHLPRFAAFAGFAVFAAGLVCLFLLLHARRISLPAVMMVIAVILIMPLAANIVYFLSKGFVHNVMVYPFFFAFIFPVYLIESAVSEQLFLRTASALRLAAAAALLFIYCCNFVIAHQLYLRRDLEFQSTLSVMTRIIDRLEQVEGYQPGYTPTALIGSLSDSILCAGRPGFDHLSAYGSNQYALTYTDTNMWYMWQILGYPFNFVSIEEHSRLARLEEVRAIPSFPAKDCFKMMDGVMVFRIGVPGLSF